MTRNYEKESEWRKKKYIRLVADVDIGIGEQFKGRLSEKILNMPTGSGKK